MRKKLWIAPVWLWVFLAFAGIAAAAFVLTLQFNVGGTAGEPPAVVILHPWACEFTLSSLGSVDECTSLPDNLGATAAISEFDDDSIFWFRSSEGNNVHNQDSVAMCPTVTDPPVDAHYQITLVGSAAAGLDPGAYGLLEMRIYFAGLEPSETVAITSDVTWAPCP